MKKVIFLLFLPLALFASEKRIYRGELFSERLSPSKFPLKEDVCRIFLIRHGETEWNVLGLSQGWVDIPLNDEGKMQAQKLAEIFSELPISAIYSSVLSRATATSAILAGYHYDADIIYDPALRFYDPSKKKALKALPKEERKKLIASEIASGATAYLKEVSRKYAGKNVIIITHGKVIKHLAYSLLGEPDDTWKVKIDNAGIVRVLSNSQNLLLEDSQFDLLRENPR